MPILIIYSNTVLFGTGENKIEGEFLLKNSRFTTSQCTKYIL